jgi:hypothetical protein
MTTGLRNAAGIRRYHGRRAHELIPSRKRRHSDRRPKAAGPEHLFVSACVAAFAFYLVCLYQKFKG